MPAAVEGWNAVGAGYCCKGWHRPCWHWTGLGSAYPAHAHTCQPKPTPLGKPAHRSSALLPPSTLPQDGSFEHPFSYMLFLGPDGQGNMVPARQLRDKYCVARQDVYRPGKLLQRLAGNELSLN